MAVERLLNEERFAADLVVEVLEQAGIEMAFGIPGGHAGHIWAALEHRQNSIRTVPVREESLGSVMAEVYGRLTRRPGVLIGQGPWVLGNGFLGTLEAKLSSSPMLLLTDFSDTPGLSLHAPYQSGTGDYGAWDARQAFRSVTKHVFEAHEPAEAVHATQLAIKHALSGQPGPVAVLFSSKAINGMVQPDSRPLLYMTQPYLPYVRSGAEPRLVEQAASALAAAARPVIIAGNGVRIAGAYTQLQALAERAGAPVATTASGKGCFAEVHPLALGVFGTFGTEAANACVSGADLVIIVGSKLSPSDTARESPALLDPSRQTLIQIDAEPRNASWSYPAEHVLIGDAAMVLEQITAALQDRNGAEDRSAAAMRVKKYRGEHGYFFTNGNLSPPTTPMSPKHVIAELQRVLPDNAIVTCDAGENRIFMTHFYQTKRAETFLQAAGAGPMGYAIPSAIGAKLVHPERTVVAVCGDGGFSMTMNGLMTAVENDIPIVTVIFNNQLLGWSAHLRSSFGCELRPFDYAAIARGMGCMGLDVEHPVELAPALEKAFVARTAAVLNVRVSTDIIFDDVVSRLAKAQGASRPPQQ
jgi:acetolactate synthase-1/2/3 large subunit